MKTKQTYGLITALAWVLGTSLLLVAATPYRTTPLIEGPADQVGLLLFMVVTALVWYGIGYHLRAKYLQELAYYQLQHPELSPKLLRKEFLHYFIYKRSKLLALLALTAIPWYIISPLRGPYTLKDYILLSLFATLALIFGIWHFRGKRKYAE